MIILIGVEPGSSREDRINWRGSVRDAAGQRIVDASVTLQGQEGSRSAKSGSDGIFEFSDLKPGKYALTVEWNGRSATSTAGLEFESGTSRTDNLRIGSGGGVAREAIAGDASGGEQLSSKQVSALPLTPLRTRIRSHHP